jgi:hypothetical protein
MQLGSITKTLKSSFGITFCPSSYLLHTKQQHTTLFNEEKIRKPTKMEDKNIN